MACLRSERAGRSVSDSEPEPPYIVLECVSNHCHAKGTRWTFDKNELASKPGLLRIPDVICDQCLVEPLRVEEEWSAV